ncbi:hypothetical protein GHT06_018148 [Daphnia sinensis]|uniref:Uncharacterized protein n=1 Tax=Daphnia sinensis TaxID=1820382 RepID=A0AAD5LDF6_9CRUS|nr:hypothetical protein GHT06_018148 [Daphnia sinensis]
MWRISSNWTGHGSSSVDLQESGRCFHTRYSCMRVEENAIKSPARGALFSSFAFFLQSSFSLFPSVFTRIPRLMDAVRDMMKRSNPLLVIRVCGFVFDIEIVMERFVRLRTSSFVTQSRTIKKPRTRR